MSNESPEVRIKLVADDHTASTVVHVKEGLHEVSYAAKDAEESVKRATHGSALGFENLKHAAKQVTGETEGISKAAGLVANPYLIAAGAVIGVGFATHEAWEFTKDLAEEALHAADAAVKQEKAMAGVMMMMDQGKHSMGELKTYAMGLREELEMAGLQAGQSAKTMVDLFDKIVEGGQIGTEKAKHLTEEIAVVGKVVRGGPEALAQGITQLERGMASQRNEMVKLIAATHTLEGNAHSVAKAMQHMSTTQRLELATKAIEKMHKQMGAGGQAGLSSLHTTFEGIKESFFESMGRPMLDKLLPPLNQLKAYILDHLESIKEFGESIGEEFGKAFEIAADISRNVYGAVVQNWDEFAKASKEFTDPIKEVWEYIYDNKDAFAKTFGDIAKDGMKLVQAIEHAIAKFIAAAKTATDLLGMTNTKENAIDKRHRELVAKPNLTKDDEKEIDELRKKYIKSREGEKGGGDAGRDFDAVQSFHADALKEGREVKEASEREDIDAVMAAYNDAAKNHRTGTMKYAAEMIMESKVLQERLLEGADIVVEGGMKQFGEMLENNEFFKKMKESRDKIKQEGGIKPPSHINDFRGSQFHIKQDFRDQDPDRVALVFRRDIMRAAVARGGSAQGSPGATGL